MAMAVMGGIERSAQQTHPEPGRVQAAANRRVEGQGRTCPDPRTTYLKVVSCSTPTGPLA